MMDGWVGREWHRNDVLAFVHFSPRSKLFKYCHVNKTFLTRTVLPAGSLANRRDQAYFALNGFETIYYSPNKSNLKAICN